jgi:hypothetical protein
MGSTGTSPKRSGEAETQNQHHRIANPEAPATQEAAQAVVNPNRTAFNQVDRVEQLLAQLEAKSATLIPYGYWNQSQAPSKTSNNWAIAAVLGCIWLSSLALAVAYFADRHSSQVAERDVHTTPLVISPPSDQQDQKTAESVNRLTKALANSSNRLNHIEAVVQKSNLDLQQVKTEVGSERTKTITQQPKAIPVEINNAAMATASSLVKANQNTAVTLVADQAAALAPKSSFNTPSVPASTKPTYQVLSVKPTDTAIPHKAADGTIDYWLVARGVFKDLYKVQPIAIAAEGVVIYSLEDGKNYTLTRQGEWRNAEW